MFRDAEPVLSHSRQVRRSRCICLLYTSDAADERSSVDLGGRRIIKKKKTEELGGDRIFEIDKKDKVAASHQNMQRS